MKYLKLFEEVKDVDMYYFEPRSIKNYLDIDPFDEEDWSEVDKPYTIEGDMTYEEVGKEIKQNSKELNKTFSDLFSSTYFFYTWFIHMTKVPGFFKKDIPSMDVIFAKPKNSDACRIIYERTPHRVSIVFHYKEDALNFLENNGLYVNQIRRDIS